MEKQILAIGYYHRGITTLKTQKEIIIMDEHQANQIMKNAVKQHPAVGTHLHETVKTKSIQKENNMRYHSPEPTLLEKIIAITFTAIVFFFVYCYFFPEQARFIFNKLFGGG